MTKPASFHIEPKVSSISIVAVCISRGPETWDISSIPFYNYSEGWRPFEHEKTVDRVRYLADRRNSAVAQALSSFPETGHILMIDSYYLHHEEQIRGLIQEYCNLTFSDFMGGCILGASTWALDKTRIMPRLRFYDGWTTPEASRLKLHEVEKDGGFMAVKAVGGCYLYPRWVWENVGYGVPDDLHGCEHNWLCEKSGLPVLLSLNCRLWREPITYPIQKRIRVSLNLGRLLRK